jgi:hypothetical protein
LSKLLAIMLEHDLPANTVAEKLSDGRSTSVESKKIQFLQHADQTAWDIIHRILTADNDDFSLFVCHCKKPLAG